MISFSNSRYLPILIAASVILLVSGIIVGFLIKTNLDTESKIGSFEECVAAGNPVMESYPPQCMTKDKRSFTQEEQVFCTLDAMACPDGSAVGRVPPSCEFAPCP